MSHRYLSLRKTLLSRRAVTYVELLVVILIIAILADASREAFLNQAGKAYDSATRQTLDIADKSAVSERLSAGSYSPQILDELANSEPGIEFVPWTDELFPVRKVSVERGANGQDLTLRELSESGSGYAMRTHWVSERPIVYKTKGSDFSINYNLVRLPSFEDGSTEWNVSAGGNTVLSKKVDQAGGGAPSGQYVFTVKAKNETGSPQELALYPPYSYSGTAVPGSIYTSAMMVSLEGSDPAGVQSIGTQMHWLNGANALVSKSPPTTENNPPYGERRVISTGVAPMSAAGVVPSVYVSVKSGATVQITVDAAIVSPTAEAIPYFDGDYPGGEWLTGGNPALEQKSISTGLAWDSW